MSDTSTPDDAAGSEQQFGVLLHSRGYLTLLLISAVIGIPISAAAFGFLALVHKLEHVVWTDLPQDLGFDEPPLWWPVLAIGLAAVVVALVVTRMPGHGGHVPAAGLGAGPTLPIELPGVLLAAGAGLILGAVVGPEAPLIALGGGLAYLAVTRANPNDQTLSILSAAGSAAAISAVFGNPLVAVVILLEVAGLGRRQAMLLTLPCLVSSGVGALVFTGLGDWTGLETGTLAIPDLKPESLSPAELLFAVPLGIVVGAAMWLVFVLGRNTASRAAANTWTITIAAGLIAGGAAALYAALTGHSPAEVASSGQAMLATLGNSPDDWTAGALLALLACKGLAYAVCIGAFRGGPAFPAIFLGAASGVLASMWVPGVDTVAGMAIGLAAGATVIGLPVTSVLLAVLLMGDSAVDLMPAIILAAVAAFVVEESLKSAKPGGVAATAKT